MQQPDELEDIIRESKFILLEPEPSEPLTRMNAGQRLAPGGMFEDLSSFATSNGFTITSGKGGKHNPGSKHYEGLAIDVRTRDKTPSEIERFIAAAQARGLRVLDERQRPKGQKVWSGPHLHIEAASAAKPQAVAHPPKPDPARRKIENALAGQQARLKKLHPLLDYKEHRAVNDDIARLQKKLAGIPEPKEFFDSLGKQSREARSRVKNFVPTEDAPGLARGAKIRQEIGGQTARKNKLVAQFKKNPTPALAAEIEKVDDRLGYLKEQQVGSASLAAPLPPFSPKSYDVWAKRADDLAWEARKTSRLVKNDPSPKNVQRDQEVRAVLRNVLDEMGNLKSLSTDPRFGAEAKSKRELRAQDVEAARKKAGWAAPFESGVQSVAYGALGALKMLGLGDAGVGGVSVNQLTREAGVLAEGNMPVDPNLGEAVLGAAGSMAAFYVTTRLGGGVLQGIGLAGKALGWAQPLIYGATEAATNAGGTFASLTESGMDENEARGMAQKQFLLELLPNIAFAKWGMPWEARGLKGIITNAAPETLQEGWQTAAQNIATGRPWSEGVEESMLVGGLAALLFSAPAGILSMRKAGATPAQIKEVDDFLKQQVQNVVAIVPVPGTDVQGYDARPERPADPVTPMTEIEGRTPLPAIGAQAGTETKPQRVAWNDDLLSDRAYKPWARLKESHFVEWSAADHDFHDRMLNGGEKEGWGARVSQGLPGVDERFWTKLRNGKRFNTPHPRPWDLEAKQPIAAPESVVETPVTIEAPSVQESGQEDSDWKTRSMHGRESLAKKDAEAYFAQSQRELGEENTRLVQDPVNPKLWQVQYRAPSVQGETQAGDQIAMALADARQRQDEAYRNSKSGTRRTRAEQKALDAIGAEIRALQDKLQNLPDLPKGKRYTSPMLRQYSEVTERYPDAIILMRVGDFYEAYGDNAKTLADTLKITLTSRVDGDNRVPMSGVPYHSVERHLAALVMAGHKVALVEPTGKKGADGLLEREVTRVEDNPQTDFKKSTEGEPRTRKTIDAESSGIATNFRKVVRGLGIPVFELNRKGAAGFFQHPGDIFSQGRIGISSTELENASVIGHEAAHALGNYLATLDWRAKNPKGAQFGEWKSIPESIKAHEIFFGTTPERAKIIDVQLRTLTFRLLEAQVGTSKATEVMAKNGRYYNAPKELQARFMESLVYAPWLVQEHAGTALDLMQQQAKAHPVIQDMLDAAAGDAIENKLTFMLWPDRRQNLLKSHGEYLGQKIWNADRLAVFNIRRDVAAIRDVIESKFENVKDDPQLLFNAAEAILSNTGGEITFGTKDVVTLGENEDATAEVLTRSGFAPGEQEGVYERVRWTPEEGKALFDKLSPEGKQLIREYTEDLSEAKDLFNRNLFKSVMNLEGKVEGYVHHYFDPDDKTRGGGRGMFGRKKAAMQMRRLYKEGFVRDLKTSALEGATEATAKAHWNELVNRQIARMAEPLHPGDSINVGNVEIVGNPKTGYVLARPDDNGTRWQIPKRSYQRYIERKLFVEEEILPVLKILNGASDFWAKSILANPGTVARNTVSGAIQLSNKWFNDLFLDVLDGKGTRTVANMTAAVETLTPNGWSKSPDWLTGGKFNTSAGQLVYNPLDVRGDKPGIMDRVQYPRNITELYFKKVVALSEQKASGKELSDVDLMMQIDRVIDRYAYNYDNIHDYLEVLRRVPGSSVIKPFATWGYKHTKQVFEMLGTPFDRAKSPKERVAGAMTLALYVSAITAWKVASHLNLDEDDNEKGFDVLPNDQMLRTSWIPFVSWFEVAEGAFTLNPEASREGMREIFGGLGPLGETAADFGLGFVSDFDKYKTPGTRLTETAASFIPFGRTLGDVADLFDEDKRPQPRNPKEAVAEQLPLFGSWRNKLRGEYDRASSKEKRNVARRIAKFFGIDVAPNPGKSGGGSAGEERTIEPRR